MRKKCFICALDNDVSKESINLVDALYTNIINTPSWWKADNPDLPSLREEVSTIPKYDNILLFYSFPLFIMVVIVLNFFLSYKFSK